MPVPVVGLPTVRSPRPRRRDPTAGRGSRPVPAAGLVAAAAAVTIMTAPGQTAVISVFTDPLIAQLGITRTELATAYLVGTLCGAAAMPFVGRALDRHGIRPVMAALAVLFSAVLVGLSLATDLVGLTAGFVGIRLAGQGALGLAATTAVAVHVTHRRGFALGVTSAVGSGGISLAPIGVERLVAAHGTAVAWRLEALAVLLVVLPLALLVFRGREQPAAAAPAVAAPAPADEAGEAAARRAGTGPETTAPAEQAADAPDADPASPRAPQPRGGPASGSVGWTAAQAVRTPMFWVIAAGLGCTGMLSTGANFHQISLLGEHGLSPVQAALNFLPQTVAALVATLGLGAVIDHVAPRTGVVVSMLLLVAALGAVPLVSPGPAAVAYGVLLGGASGSIRAVEAAAYSSYYGTTSIGAIRGIATTVSVASTAFGPLLLAVGHDLTGSYTPVVLAAAVLPLATAGAALVTPGPAPTPAPAPAAVDDEQAATRGARGRR